MTQKILKVGNSFALTIPRSFIDKVGFKAGDEVYVQEDLDNKLLLITVKENANRLKLSPDLFTWLDKIEKKYQKAILELAKK
jgi:putative addiction module antidote